MKTKENLNFSGSCALIALFIGFLYNLIFKYLKL